MGWLAVLLLLGMVGCEAKNPTKQKKRTDITPEDCGTGRWGSLPVGDYQTVLYVDQGSASEEEKGTESEPYRTISAALEAVASGPETLIAIAEGTYSETLYLWDDALIGTHIAGRCTALVELDTQETVGGNWVGLGVQVTQDNDAPIVISGMTVTGGYGFGVSSGFVRLDDMLFRACPELSLYATGRWSILDLQDVTIEGAIDKSGKDCALRADSHATLTGENLHIRDSASIGICLENQGTSLTMTGLQLHEMRTNDGGRKGYALIATDQAEATLTDAVISGAHGSAVFAQDGAHVTMIDGQVSQTHYNPSEEAGRGFQISGRGILTLLGTNVSDMYEGVVVDGGTATLEDATISGIQTGGLLVDGGGEGTVLGGILHQNQRYGARVRSEGSMLSVLPLDGQPTRIYHNAPNSDDSGGMGIIVEDGAHLHAEGAELRYNHQAAILVSGEGTTADIRDTTISDTLRNINDSTGSAIFVTEGGTVDASGLLLERNSSAAVFASAGGSITVTGSEITDTLMDKNMLGAGVGVIDGGHATVADTTITRSHYFGAFIYDAESTLTITDSEISDTQLDRVGDNGFGVLQWGGMLRLEEVMLLRNHRSGVLIMGPDAQASLERVSVQYTQPTADGRFGRGVAAIDGAIVTISELEVDHNHDLGLSIEGDGTQVTVVDTTISNMLPQAADGASGIAVQVDEHGSLDATRLTISSVPSSGMLVNNATATLRDLIIRDVYWTPALATALGLTAQLNARVTVEGAVFENIEGPGIYMTLGSLLCTRCRLLDSRFAALVVLNGAALQIDNTDLERTVEADILRSAPDERQTGGGVGVFIDGGAVILDGVHIDNHELASIWAQGRSSLSVNNSVLTGNTGESVQASHGASYTQHGSGLYARGLDDITLTSTYIADNAGIGVFLNASVAQHQDLRFANNAEDLVQQDCDGIEPMPLPEGATGSICDSGHPYRELGFALYLLDAEQSTTTPPEISGKPN